MRPRSTLIYDFEDLTHDDPHDDFFSSTYPSGDPQSHGSAQAPLHRQVERGPPVLTLSLEPQSRFSESFGHPVSPLISPSLKRRSHIRRKERPWRLSQTTPSPHSDVTNTYQPKRSSEPFTTSPSSISPSSTRSAYSPQNRALSYNPPLFAPIRGGYDRSSQPDSPEQTYLTFPDPHGGSPPSLGDSHNPPSGPTRADVRQETQERRDFAPFESHTRPPSNYAASYIPRLPPTQLRKESWDTVLDSASVYSLVTGTGSFHLDITGDIKPNGSLPSWETKSIHWDLDAADHFWSDDSESRISGTFEPDSPRRPENDRPWLVRQNTAVIVELLRQRRRRAGME